MSTRPGTLVHRATHEPHEPYGRPFSEQQRRTTSKPLNFKKAMDDFQFMFPELDRHVIETVLRANNGVVQSTIDQLLILQESTPSEVSPKEENFDFPELPTYESSIGNGEEPPPAYSSVWEEANRDSIDGPNQTLTTGESIKRQSLLMANTFWKAPLVGELPDDFLRLDISVKAPVVKKKTLNTRYQLSTSPTNEFLTDEESSSISEDEKLAIFLQNEEFLRELRRNQEFVSALEADHRRAMMGASGGTTTPTPSATTTETLGTTLEQPSATPPTESVSSGGARPRTTNPILDDAAFKQKLKHMGKSTKKKFSKMAKKFSRRNPGTRNQFLHASDSTFNLLENNEDETEYVEEGLNGIMEDGGEEYDEDDVTNDKINRSEELSATSRHLPKTPIRTGTQITQVNGHTGRQLPQPPGGTKSGNTEPIVFYDDDNEFSYKNE